MYVCMYVCISRNSIPLLVLTARRGHVCFGRTGDSAGDDGLPEQQQRFRERGEVVLRDRLAHDTR